MMNQQKKQIYIGAAILGAVILCIAIVFLPVLINGTRTNVKEKSVLYIEPGASFAAVIDSITPFLKDMHSFISVANHADLQRLFKPGRYVLTKEMSNKEIVRMMIVGRQTPMMLTLSGNIRGKEKLAALLGKKLAADSLDFIRHFNDSLVWQKYGLKEETFISLFIPDSYEVYWTISPEQFTERMKKENDRFWNQARDAKAKELNLSRVDVSILASIVCEESNYKPELSTIAGVYLNRLKKGMKLDADPTVKYALGDPSVKRILFKHLEIDSPYNTYKKTGLPPGPITIPSSTGLDAVLNYQPHKYLYFCANAKLDGTHEFAQTLGEHNKNAKRYQAAISKLSRGK